MCDVHGLRSTAVTQAMREKTALVLSGGGARAAYQVGVLKALARLQREHVAGDAPIPFSILCGTSAGAINAAALACRADRFRAAVDAIAQVWQGFRAEQVYRADLAGITRTGAKWLTAMSVGWLLGRHAGMSPRSLLDNTPLTKLFPEWAPLGQLPQQLENGYLRALGIGVSSYTGGEHLTFFQAADVESGYTRTQRLAVPMQLRTEHLVASAAIPFVFPAQRIEHVEHAGWYGDGSMRQIAPISPAIHLGAQRVLIVGVGRMHEPARQVDRNSGYPSLAQVGGHALSSIFLDGLTVDIERMERINRTLALMSDEQRAGSRLVPVQALVIAPSERIDEIAARHQKSLPAPVRALLRGVGASSTSSDTRAAAFASYLLFESSFTQELMALGEWDALAKGSSIRSFFGWG